MKNTPFSQTIRFSIVGVLASGALVSAQLPDSTTSREVVSATGCLQQATAAEAAAGGDGLEGAFMLRGMRVGPSTGLAQRPALPPTSPGSAASSETDTAEPARAAAPQAAGASAADIAPSRRDSGLRLVGDRGVDLSEHVGHRVLVTGRLSSFAAPGGVASTASGRTLTVTNISLIAPACTVGS